MIFIVDLNHDLSRWLKSTDLNQIHPVYLAIVYQPRKKLKKIGIFISVKL